MHIAQPTERESVFFVCVQRVVVISSSVITLAFASEDTTSVTVIASVAIIRTNTTAVSDIFHLIQLLCAWSVLINEH